MISAFFRKLAINYLFQRSRPRLNGEKKRLQTCIFKVDRLGDFVLSLGAIRQLTSQYGESSCAIIVYKLVADLARKEFPSATIISLSAPDANLRDCFRAQSEFANRLDCYSFENLVCLRHQRTLFHDLALSRIEADCSFGVENSFSQPTIEATVRRFIFDKIIARPKTASRGLSLEQESHRRLLSSIFEHDLSPEDVLPKLQYVPNGEGKAIAITPFTSSNIRDYPALELVKVLAELRRILDAPFHLCGGPEELDRLELLRETALQMGIKDVFVHQPGTFVDFVTFIGSCRGILTMDTSTAHLATALDKPTVVVLGGGHYGHFGPWHRSAKQIWLTNQLPCFGCGWHCIHSKALCISEIPARTIATSFLKVLSQGSAN